jgi:spermidine synthase
MVILLFFCSGATALVYEVLWSKYLTLLFGSTVQAQTVVLAIFMGGLALGNRLFGARADRLARPLAAYGYIEAGIGLYAFFFSSIYRGADTLFSVAGANLLQHGAWLLLLKGFLSAALLLGPTLLMGGSLPLLAAWLQKNTPDAGRRAAVFYSTNSLGAVCGAGLAGFFLVTWLGLPVTLQMTGLVNVLIGLTAVAIARCQNHSLKAPDPVGTAEESSGGESAPAVFRWACFLVTMTGAVSMGLEVLASRCLSMIFGASLQAFAIVLMAFILGIGVGSAVIASRRRTRWPREITTVVLVLTAALWIGLVVFNIEFLVAFYMHAKTGLSSSAMGYRYNQLISALFSMVILGIPAGAIGGVLPLWIRVVSEKSDLLGDRVGRLLTWNTFGAVTGVLLTGFVLMPRIGLRGSFATLALVLSGGAMFVAFSMRRRFAGAMAGVACGLLVLVAATGGENWRSVLSSGVFRFREEELTDATLKNWLSPRRILFYEDAADATVSVEEEGTPANRELGLRVNGKPDASTQGDLSTQLLCAHLPLMVKPTSKDVFVLGMGSGVTAGAVLGYPVEHLTVAENCEPILRAAQWFGPWNNGVLTNARTEICSEDARTVLKLSPRKYDVIIAEPSNPWTVGIGSVFSREFYQLAANRLKQGGIMVQWFHVYEMSDPIVSLVLRTFSSVYPVVEIWDASHGDILILGANEPWKSGPDVFAEAFRLAGPRRDLESIGLRTPEAVLARQLASQRTGFAIAGPGPVQTDEFPLLEYAAPKAFFIGRTAVVLCRYDERTWQADLAPGQKTRLLAGLGWTNVCAALGGRYRSVNPDVHRFVARRSEPQPGKAYDRIAGGFAPPCVFEAVNDVVLKPPPAGEKNPTAQKLFAAELVLASKEIPDRAAIDEIEQILMTEQAPGSSNGAFHPDYYASIAAKARLRLGDSLSARKILLRGLQVAPSSDQLQFLARVMAREGVLQSSEVPVAIALAQPPN